LPYFEIKPEENKILLYNIKPNKVENRPTIE
jgi:hypothetical protein